MLSADERLAHRLPLSCSARVGPARLTRSELLKQRRYSLIFEGGHRGIDARRFNPLGDLPLDQPMHIRIPAFQIPLSECQARDPASPCTA